jgi:hypothetical protein
MTGLGGQDWGGIDPPNPVVHPQFGHVAKFKTAVRGDDRIGGVDTGLGGYRPPQSCRTPPIWSRRAGVIFMVGVTSTRI